MGSRALAAELRAVVEGSMFGTHDRKVVERVLGDLEELLHRAENTPEKLDCADGAVTVDEALYLPGWMEGEVKAAIEQIALSLKEEMRELGALQQRVATGITKTVKPGLEKLVAAVKEHRENLRR